MKNTEVRYPIIVDKHLKEAFFEACQNQDTVAAKEIRHFMRSFVAKHGQKKLL